MGILRKKACPSPRRHSSQAQAPPLPAQGASSLPAQGVHQLPAQGPASNVHDSWDYTFHTLNINAWSTFKSKLDDLNFLELLGNSTILLLQEHKMLTQDEADSAIAHCARRGYTAIFGLAKRLDSGKASGGVGVLIKEGLNMRHHPSRPRLRRPGAQVTSRTGQATRLPGTPCDLHVLRGR